MTARETPYRSMSRTTLTLLAACLLAAFLGFLLHGVLVPPDNDPAGDPGPIVAATAPAPAPTPPAAETRRRGPPRRRPVKPKGVPELEVIDAGDAAASAPGEGEPASDAIPVGATIRGYVLDEYGVGIANARVWAQLDTDAQAFRDFVLIQRDLLPEPGDVDELIQTVSRSFGRRRGRRRGGEPDPRIETVVGGRRARMQLKTGEDGAFELVGLVPGKWWIGGSAERYIEGRTETEAAFETVVDVDVILSLGAEVIGVVRNATTGQGVEGARVSAVHARSGDRKRAQTDPMGSFEMAGLRDGEYRFSVEATDHVPLEPRDHPPVEIVAALGPAVVDLELRSGAAFSGTIYDETGRPVGGALLFATREADIGGRGRSEEDGTYRVSRLEDGEYDILVRSEDYARTGRLAVQVAEGIELAAVDIVIAPAGRIEGHVVGSDGAPLTGVTVFCSEEGTGHAERRSKTDENGAYAIENLYAGKYRVSVGREGQGGLFEPVRQVIDIGPGELIRRDFVLELGAVVRGMVVGLIDGQPKPGVAVFAIVGGDYKGRTRTNEEGRFEVRGLPTGEYTFFLRGEGRDDPTRGGLGKHIMKLASGEVYQDVVLTVAPPARVEGIVIGPDGRPLAGIRVTAQAADGQPVRRNDRTDEGGRFSIGNLYDGAYRVSVSAGDLRRVGVAWPDEVETPAVDVRIAEGRGPQDGVTIGIDPAKIPR